jgi:TolB-like protein
MKILTALLFLLLGGNFVPLSALAQCSSARIDALSASLAEELVTSLQTRLDRSAPVIAIAFADLHNVKATSPLGRILAEELGNALQAYGYRVADQRAFSPTPFTRTEHGETALSTDPDHHGAPFNTQAILTGTYAQADGGVRVSARLIRIKDNSVLASAGCRLRLTQEVATLLTPSTLAAAPAPPPATLLALTNKTDAQQVQQALAAQGLYRGKIDGIWGKQSRTALMRFRASLGLPATADWNLETQNALLPRR